MKSNWKSKTTVSIYSTILILYIVSTISRLLFHGFVGRFDYFLYQPDGALYTHLALRYSGISPHVAAEKVNDWYQLYGKPGLNFPQEFFSPDLNPDTWTLVSVRVLYPLLSTPFVQVLGIPGMLVIPVMSYGILLLVITLIAKKMNNLPMGLVLVFLLTTSNTVSRWFISNITDGLLAALFAILMLVLLGDARKKTIIVLILITLTSFTRFCLPIWLAIGVFLLLKQKVALGFSTIGWSIMNFLPILLVNPDLSFVAPKANQNVAERGLEFVWLSLRLIFVEMSQLIATDRALFAIILAALLFSMLDLQKESSRLFILVALAVWFIGAINPVLGVNFRYQLPLLGFACWTILDQFHIARYRPPGNALHIK